MPQPRFAPSYSKTRIIDDGINTIASHFSILPHPTRHYPGPAASHFHYSSLRIISHTFFSTLTNSMQIINGRKKVIEGRLWLIGDKQKVDNLELFSKFAI